MFSIKRSDYRNQNIPNQTCQKYEREKIKSQGHVKLRLCYVGLAHEKKEGSK